ncbi:MAG: hypothetical protein HYV97_05895 [Bdellovibrio sp.]|nr:hypothetical protein [Bdellovibrio sp.]
MNYLIMLFWSFVAVSAIAAEPCAITSVEVLLDGTVTTRQIFHVGETVTIKINAEDPANLPMTYVYRRFRRNILDVTLQNWDANFELAYTFTAGDLGRGFLIIVGVKNNDGIDMDPLYGDAIQMVELSVIE